MAINFNGTNQWGDMAGVLFSSDAAYTLVAYVKCDNTTTAEQHIVGEYGTGTNTRQSAFVYRADQTTKSISKKKTNGTVYYGTAATSFVPVQGSWNTIIQVRSSTGSAAGATRFMLNNGTVDVTAQAENGSTDLNRFSVGAYKLGTGPGGTISDFFKGSIAAIAVYSRAINTTEEGQLKVPTRPTAVSTTNLVEYWEFSGSGAATTSTGVNGRVLTWFNSPTLDTDLPFASITGIGTAGTVTMDDGTLTVTNTLTTSGLGPVTSIVLSTPGHGSHAATNITGSTGSYTFIFRKFADGDSQPYFGTVTATVSDGTTTVQTTCTLAPPGTFQLTQLNSVVTTDNTYLGYWFAAGQLNKPLLNNEYIYAPYTNSLIVNPDSGVRVNAATVTKIYVHRNTGSPNDGFIEEYDLIINEVSQIVGLSTYAINDAASAILNSFGFSGNLSAQKRKWMLANGGSGLAYNDILKSFLTSKGITSLSVIDGWAAYLKGKGYSGSVIDMEKKFWIDGGAA